MRARPPDQRRPGSSKTLCHSQGNVRPAIRDSNPESADIELDQEPTLAVSGRTLDVPNSSKVTSHARQGGARSISVSDRVSSEVLPAEFPNRVAPPTERRQAAGLCKRSTAPLRNACAPRAQRSSAASRARDPRLRAEERPGRDMVLAKFTSKRRKGPLSRIAPCGPSPDGLPLRTARSRCRGCARRRGPVPGRDPAPAPSAAPARARGPRTTSPAAAAA